MHSTIVFIALALVASVLADVTVTVTVPALTTTLVIPSYTGGPFTLPIPISIPPFTTEAPSISGSSSIMAQSSLNPSNQDTMLSSLNIFASILSQLGGNSLLTNSGLASAASVAFSSGQVFASTFENTVTSIPTNTISAPSTSETTPTSTPTNSLATESTTETNTNPSTFITTTSTPIVSEVSTTSTPQSSPTVGPVPNFGIDNKPNFAIISLMVAIMIGYTIY